MKILIYIGGFYCLAFAIFHLAFWKLFDWKTELRKLNAINCGVMQVLNIQLAYVFFAFAFLCFAFAEDLLTTALGKALLISISVFWLIRAINQPIFWKFDKIGAAFFIVFLIGAGIFAFPLL